MWKKFCLFIMSAVLSLTVGCAGTKPKITDPANSSIVIGCFEGHVIAKEGDEYDGSPEWKLKGFRLVDTSTTKSRRLKIGRDGCFTISTLPGLHDLTRLRTGASDAKYRKWYDFYRFIIPAASLVNVGTFEIVTEGPTRTVSGQKIQFKIVQKTDEQSFKKSMNWFSSHNLELFETYKEKLVISKKGGN